MDSYLLLALHPGTHLCTGFSAAGPSSGLHIPLYSILLVVPFDHILDLFLFFCLSGNLLWVYLDIFEIHSEVYGPYTGP